MIDGRIKKLRNKIWFSLWITLFVIISFAMVIVYLSHASFQRQQFQNTMHHVAPITLEHILLGYDMIDPPGAFVIQLDDTQLQAISIKGDTNFNLRDANDIVTKVRHQTGGLGSRIRDRFLWRLPTPFIEFQQVYWSYVPVFGDTNSQSEWTPHLVFWDATSVADEVTRFRNNFFLASGLIFLVIGTISYLITYLLVKPTAIAFERQKQFITDISHELKTPLTMIKNNLNVLQIDKKATIETQSHWVDNIDFAYVRMNNLITDLLTLSKLENYLDETNISKFDFSQVANWIINSMKCQFDAKEIYFSSDIEPGIIVNQNADKMMQVMVILLDNAIKYVNVGGTIVVDVKRMHQTVTFKVKNSGLGISATHLPNIFERFYRVESSRNSTDKSYGLGLAIAKTIIEQAGGKINASSIPNEMTTISFTIKTVEDII